MTAKEAMDVIVNHVIPNFDEESLFGSYVVDALNMAVNAVGAIDQIQWERDMAIKQLHDLGYGLGEKVKKSSNLIDRQAAIDAAIKATDDWDGGYNITRANMIEKELNDLPSAQLEIEESLYQYKCFITDTEGLQHEVVHVGDIRRVTGWEI